MGAENGLPNRPTLADSVDTENGSASAADTAPPPVVETQNEADNVSSVSDTDALTPPPVVEVLPMAAKHAAAMAKQQRQPNGQFAKGNRLASSRPIDEFVSLCREIADRYKLAQELGRMATGKEPYKRASAEVRLKACELLLSYAFGRPRIAEPLEAAPGEEVRYQRVQYIKRIHGVDPEAV